MLRKIPYYKLLLFILLIVGCAREYDCDIGTIDDDGEFHSIGGPDTYFQSSMTLDWPDGEKETEEHCEDTYNEVASEAVVPETYYCRCEKSN